MNSSVGILGQPLKLIHSNNKEIMVIDPFSCTAHDFIQYCVKELTKVLHTTVVYTYNNLITKKQQKHFFLTGFVKRRGWNNKLFGDPTVLDEGKNIRWLIKNIRWNFKKYALYTDIYEDTFEDITGFFLYDILQYVQITGEEKFDDNLVLDCYDAALELVSAIADSKYYINIAEDILKNKSNLESLLPIFREYQTMVYNQNQFSHGNLDSNFVLQFLGNKSLLSTLRNEERIHSSNPLDKPLTSYFLNVVMSRFNNNQFTGDSGIVDDIHTSQDETQYLNNRVLASSSTDQAAHLLSNQSMDGSMIIINRCESTPKASNKSVKLLTNMKNTPSKNISPHKAYSKTKSNDFMDGSFVLL